MKKQWYYGKNNNPDDLLCDEFLDSKFGIDSWTSFAREIIQNSLDAKDTTLPNNIPVRIVFDLNRNLSINDIPGGTDIIDTLQRCINNTDQKRTKEKYEAGLTLLSREKIPCVKVSDYNTTGLKTGRDEAWGALIYDTGKSIKQRPGSAGSYGVGKKVPFIISDVNTVFYATYNETDKLLEGKSILTDFKDSNNIRRTNKGWYGLFDIDENDPRNCVHPIDATSDYDIHPYFKRLDKKGTDVIIVGVDIKDKVDKIKELIVNAILENFFIAIRENKLEVIISGFELENTIEINQRTFDNVLNKYYSQKIKFKKETSTLVTGNLINYRNALYQQPEIIDIPNKENSIGQVYLYFLLGNDKKKKYYSIVRSHGMKICDYQCTADQPYSAVAYIKGKKLNEALSNLENAAHDDFITKDDSLDKKTVQLFKLMKKSIDNRIKELSKIQPNTEQNIEGLDSMLSVYGDIQKVSQKEVKPKIRKSKINTRKKDKQTGGPTTPRKPPKHPPITGGKNKKRKSIKEPKFKSVHSFSYGPYSVITNGSYRITFRTKKDIPHAEITLYAIGSDGKIDKTIGQVIESAKFNGQLRKVNDNRLRNIKISSENNNVLDITMRGSNLYQIDIEIVEIVTEV